MISLEMVGFRDRSPGSQNCLPYLNINQFPDTGDFIAFVGKEPSSDLTLSIKNGMQQSAPNMSIEHLIALGRGDEFHEIRLSDHSPFCEARFPEVMISDTAYFRNPPLR